MLFTDLRSAIRSLRSAPGLVLAVVVMLGLASGVNLVMLGLVSRALLAPPALVTEPDRLFTLMFGRDDGPAVMSTTSYPTFVDVTGNVPAVEAAAAWQRTSGTLGVDGEQVPADVTMVVGDYFAMLGVTPIMGRIPDTGAGSAEAGLVLGHRAWRSAFGADPAVIGRRVTIAGIPYEVSAVMPEGFSGHSTDRTDAWVPLATALQDEPGWRTARFRNIVSVTVRLRDDASPAAAAEQSTAVLERTVALRPAAGAAAVSSTDRQVAVGLAAISLLVVVIALANAATLLLVRGANRSREMAVRQALGASRGRLMSQTACEALLLAGLAAVVALALATWFDEAVRAILFRQVVEQSGITGRVVAAALLAAVATAAVAALAGLSHIGSSPAPRLAAGTRSATSRGTLQRGLLVVQVTVSIVLLVGAGIFGRSLYTLTTQDFGFSVEDVLVVDVPPGPGGIGDGDSFYTAALERVRRLPGVRSAAPIQSVPFRSFHVIPISAPGRPPLDAPDRQLPFLIAATPDLFATLGVRILEGRAFTAADERGAPVVVVNQSMARTIWPGQSALGQCIRIGFDDDFDPELSSGPPPPPVTAPCREVVGVAADMRQRSVTPSGDEARLMQYFVPFAQVPSPHFAPGGPTISGLLVRASTDPAALAPAIHRAVVDGRADLTELRVMSYAAILGRQLQPWRMATSLLALFATLALAVAAIGLYAAFAHIVVTRRREIAIRLAIGADRGRVMRMLLEDAARVTFAGVVTGAVIAALAGRLAQSMLFGTGPADPLVIAAAAILMLVVTLAATLLPARSAGRTDPNELLRAE